MFKGPLCHTYSANGSAVTGISSNPLFGDYSRMRCGKGASRSGRRQPSPERATGPPRVEHLASSADLSAKIQLNSSGVTHIKLPENFDGVALVMLSSDWSCEWRILNPKMSSLASPLSLLQRQLCLAQPFSPQSHMALQASLR